MKKLYKVEITDTVYVVADSEQEAERAAKYNNMYLELQCNAVECTKSNFDKSGGWSLTDLPIDGDEDKTISDYLHDQV